MVDNTVFDSNEECPGEDIETTDPIDYSETCEALTTKNELSCVSNSKDEEPGALCRLMGCLTRMEVLLRCTCDIESDRKCKLVMNTINVEINPNENLCFGIGPVSPDSEENPISPIAAAQFENCPKVEKPLFGKWNCKNSTCKLRCQDGYWTPNRSYQCNCLGDKCNWTGRNRIHHVKCQEAKCPDLIKNEKTNQWSCSGRSNWDICWSPCKVGSL